MPAQTCPQCNAVLPAMVRACPSCGTSFITTHSAVLKQAIARAQEAASTAQPSERRPKGKFTQEQMLQGLVAGFLLCVSMALYSYWSHRPRSDQPRELTTGFGTVPNELDTRLKWLDQNLIVERQAVELRGHLTNNSDKQLAGATLVTTFRDGGGKPMGSARGTVATVSCGRTVPYVITGKLDRPAGIRQTMNWSTKLEGIKWASAGSR